MAPVRKAWRGVTPQLIDDPKLAQLIASLESMAPSGACAESEPVDVGRLVSVLEQYPTWPFEEQVQLTEWVKPLDAIDAALNLILKKNPLLLLVDPVERKTLRKTTASGELVSSRATTLDEVQSVPEQVLSGTKSILRFLVGLFRNASAKSVFNSVDEIADMLAAADDELSSLALEALSALVTPPALHRQQSPEGHHNTTTPIHPSKLAVHRRLVALARGWGSRGAGLGLLQCVTLDDSEQGQRSLSVEAGEISFQYFAKEMKAEPMEVDGEATPNEWKTGGSSKLETLRLVASEIVLPTKRTVATNVLSHCSKRREAKPTAELFFRCLEKAGGGFPSDQLFALLVDIRLARSFYSQSSRIDAAQRRLLALAATLNSHPSTDTISGYFQAQPELCVELVDLLRPTVASATVASGKKNVLAGSGFTSLDALACPPQVPFRVRSLAMDCLTALVARREGSHSALTGVARLNNVLNELGVGKGIYLGLLPTLVRYTLSSLNSFLSSSSKSTVETKKPELEDEDVGVALDIGFAFLDATKGSPMPGKETLSRALEFTETLLTIASAVVSAPNGTASLIDSGLIPSLLEVIAMETKTVFPSSLGLSDGEVLHLRAMLRLISAQAIQVLEGTLVTHNHAASAIHDMKGSRIVVNRMHEEILQIIPQNRKQDDAEMDVDRDEQGSSQVRTLSASRRVVLFSAMNCLSVMCHHESSSTASTTAELIREPQLTACLVEFLEHVDVYDGILVAMASSFLSDIMNSDPQVVHHVHNSGIGKAFLDMCNRVGRDGEPCLPTVPELIISVPNVLSALALTSEGAKRVERENPFPSLVKVLYHPKYVMPRSNCLLNEISSVIGPSFDEIMRHVPSLRSLVVKAIVDGMKGLVKLGADLVHREEASVDEDECLLNERSCLMQYAMNFGHLLEQILQTEEHCGPLFKAGVMEVILELHPCLMATSTEFLANASCASCPSITTLCHTTTEGTLQNAFRGLIGNVEPQKIIKKLNDAISKTLGEIEDSQAELRRLNGSPQPLVDQVMPLNEILLCIPDQKLHLLDRDNEKTRILCTSRFLRAIALFQIQINCLCTVIRCASQRSQDSGTGWGRDEREWKNQLSSPDFVALVNRASILQRSAFRESCWYRSQVAYEAEYRTRLSAEANKQVHYLLRIVSQEGAVVRDGIEIDSCVNVGGMEMGEVVEAYSRCLNSSGVMRYHTKRGWVSELTRGHSREAISEVINVFQVTDAMDDASLVSGSDSDVSTELGVATLRDVGSSILARLQNSYCDVLVSLSRVLSQSARALPVRTMSFDAGTVGAHVQSLNRIVASHLQAGLDKSNWFERTNKDDVSCVEGLNRLGTGLYTTLMLGVAHSCLFEDRRERRVVNLPLMIRLVGAEKEDGRTEPSVVLSATTSVLSRVMDETEPRLNNPNLGQTPKQLLSRGAAAMVPPAIALLRRLLSTTLIKSSPLCSLFERMEPKQLSIMIHEVEDRISTKFKPETYSKGVHSMVARSMVEVWRDPRFRRLPSHLLYPLTSLSMEVINVIEEDLKPPKEKDGRATSGLPGSLARRMRRDLGNEERRLEEFVPSEETVSTIMEMGFSRDHALEALERTESNRLEVAMEYALSHPPPSPSTAERRRAERAARSAERQRIQERERQNDGAEAQELSPGRQAADGDRESKPNDSKDDERKQKSFSGDEKGTEDEFTVELRSTLDDWVQLSLDLGLNAMDMVGCDAVVQGEAEHEARTVVAATSIIELCRRYKARREELFSTLLQRLKQCLGDASSFGKETPESPQLPKLSFACLCHMTTLFARAFTEVRFLLPRESVIEPLICVAEREMKRNDGLAASRWLSQVLLLLDVAAQPIAAFSAADLKSVDKKSSSSDRSELCAVKDEHRALARKQDKLMQRVFSVLHPTKNKSAQQHQTETQRDADGTNPTESSEKKTDEDSLPSPPAFAPLMSSSLQHRCAQLCVEILKGECSAGGEGFSPGVVHACLLLLSQLVRSPSVARYCISVGAPEKIMSLSNGSRFSGRTGLVATLFRRLIEDESTLQSSMETAIRGALLKRSRLTSNQSTEKPRVGLIVFFDSVTPLICRDSLAFVKAAAVTISVSNDKNSSRQETVTLLTPEERQRNQKLLLELDRDDSGAERPGPLKRQRSLSKGKTGKSPLRRTSSVKKSRKERSSSGRTVLDGSPANHVSSLVISKIVEQCLAEDCNGYGESSAFLWVADLVEILGDLVLAVPACAAAIHRFRSRVRPNPLSTMRNALRRAGTPPRTFVSLLLHELLPIDRWSLRKDTTRVLNGDAGKESSRDTSRRFFIASRLLQTSGRLLVALVARAGEGRRRVVGDLARALGGSTASSPSFHSDLSAASCRHHSALRIWGELCFGLASPKGNLAFSESSTPLSYEVVKVMLEAGIVQALLTGLAAVDLESSYASSTCMSLLIPLELFTRPHVTDAIERIEEKEAASKAKKEKTGNTPSKKPDRCTLDQSQRRESQFADDAMLEEAFSPGPTVGGSFAMDAHDDDESDIESDSDGMDVMSDDNSDVSDSEEESAIDNSEGGEDENSVLSVEEQDEEVDGNDSQEHDEDWQQQEEYFFDDDPAGDMGSGGAVLESDMEEGWTRIESPAGLGNLLAGAGGRRILGMSGQVSRGGSRGIAEAAQAMLGNFFRTADIPPETVADIEENLGIRITHRDSGDMVIRGPERSFGSNQDGGHRSGPGEGLGTLPQVGQRTPPETGYTGLGFEGSRLSEISSIEYIYGGPALASGSRNYDLSHVLEPESELYPAPNGSEIYLFPTGAAGAANLRARRTFHPLLHGVELPPVNSLVSDLLPQDTRALRRNHPTPPRRYAEAGNIGHGFTLLSSSGGVAPRRRDFRTTSSTMTGWTVHDDLPLEPTLGEFRSEFLRLYTYHAESSSAHNEESTQGNSAAGGSGTNEHANETTSATCPESTDESGEKANEAVAGQTGDDERSGPVSNEQADPDPTPPNREDSEGVASSLAAGLRISSASDNMSTDESGDREMQQAADSGPPQEPERESDQPQDADSSAIAGADGSSVSNNVEESSTPGPSSETLPNEHGFVCPPGMDNEAFNALPPEVQQEVVNQHRITEEVTAQLDPSSGLDPRVLAELPEDMRREAIAQDRREREDAARSAQPADPSNATEMDNASFLVSLTPELREEILLTADENFLNSLPPNVLAEAQLLRERASVRHQTRVSNDNATHSNRETNEGGQPNANSGSRRRRTRALTGKVKADCDRSQVIFIPQGLKKERGTVAFGCSQMQTILRLLFLLSPVRPHRLLQKLLSNLSSNRALRASLINFFTKVLNDELTEARESLASIGPSDTPVHDETFPPSTLIGASPSTCDADQATRVTGLFRSGRQGMLSDAIASNLPKSSLGSTCDGTTPVVVSARIIDTCNYLGANSQRFCVDMMGGVGLGSCVRENYVEELVDLLSKSRFKSSSANLEQLLQMLETLLAPLGSLPFPGSDESEVSQGELDAAASSRKEYVDVPRLVVSQERLRLLCSVLKLESCKDSAFTKVNTIVKRLSRVDANRGFILSELGTVAHSLGSDAIRELRALKIRMDDTIAMKASRGRESGTGAFAAQSATFNGSSSVTLSNTSSEVKLLRVLTTLQSLCTESDNDDSRGSDNLRVTQELVDMLRDIDLHDLWEELSGCLESVKTLEGIEDSSEQIEENDGDNEEGGEEDDNQESKKLKNSAAGLLTRFLPAIETFFVVNASSTRQEESSKDAATTVTKGDKDKVSSHPSLVGGKQLTSFVSDNRILINALIRNSPSLLDKKLSAMVHVEHLRGFLDFDVKRQWFKSQIRRLRHQANRRHGSLRLSIRRKYVFEDTYHQLRLRNADEMRGRLNISFTNEEGVDAGGLSREFFAILAKEMFNPNYALFTATEDGCTFQPNPNSSINPDHLSYLRFVGRIVGKAVSDGYLLDAHFTRSLYKHMLGLQPTHHDMEAIDPDYYKNLKMILEYSLAHIGLELTFSIDDHSFGRNQVIDLIPNGRKCTVTDESKAKYVQLVCKHRMTTAISGQIKAFLDGFYEMVSRDLIAIFTPRELELLISGLPDIDVLDLKRNTDYNGYKATDKEIQWFWNIMMTLTRPQKAAFLQFVTGSSKVPLAGFSELQGMRGVQKFSITKAGGSKGALMSAHTCFNSLDLPLYKSEEEMKEKLLYAISEGQGAFLFA